MATHYVLDPTGLAEVLMESTGGQSKYYVPGLAEYDTAWSYYLPDRLGSVRQMANTAGQLTLAQSFDPFGNVLEQTGAGQSSFGYTAEQTDPSGLVFLRARYYNPAVGRFITADEMIPDPLSSGGWNRYAYVGNNPIRYTDPSGYLGCEGFGSKGNTAVMEVSNCLGGGRGIGGGALLFGLGIAAFNAADKLGILPPFKLLPSGAYGQQIPPYPLGEYRDANYCPTPTLDAGSQYLGGVWAFPSSPPYFGPMPGIPTLSIPWPNIWLANDPFRGYNPNIPIGKLLEGTGQIPALTRNPNLKGIPGGTLGLLKKTLVEAKQILTDKQFRTLMKHFENRDLRHGK